VRELSPSPEGLRGLIAELEKVDMSMFSEESDDQSFSSNNSSEAHMDYHFRYNLEDTVHG
jgi:hypothetical protein